MLFFKTRLVGVDAVVRCMVYGAPASHAGVGLCPGSLLTQLGKAAEVGPSVGVPATHMEDPDEAPVADTCWVNHAYP